MTYSAPVKDILFALEEVAAIGGLKTSGGYAELTDDLILSVLEEAGKIATEILAPLNAVGDKIGLVLDGDQVRTPPGFIEAYRAFADGGWLGLAADPDFGGAGLPHSLAAAVYEMVQGANMAFGLAPILSLGAMDALCAHANKEIKALYLPKLVSGEWLATMNLTEPQAGSDVGALKARAELQADGTYRLFGSKIFITWGEHDLTENILHLVLARLPDAPSGTRGISLFLAPKFLLNPDGSLGARNDLKCTGLEHKLGIHASPTCSMAFGENDGAVAYLIGHENKGMAAMFTMMNAARLMVGVQGVGLAEHAFQKALAFSKERRQGKAEGVDGHARIIEHPDVRRMLWLMKSKIEAARAITYMTALAADESLVAQESEDRAFGKRREELLTPVAKAWSTDIGVEIASAGVQIHGGMGFIEETGAAQFYRDARIAPIYEGTNGIQAIDLLCRKLTMEGGLAFADLLEDIRQTVEDCETSSNSELVLLGGRLQAGADSLEASARWLGEMLDRDRQSALAGATPFLSLMGDVCGGWALAISAVAAQRLLKEGDESDAYLNGKIAGARFYAEAVLSTVPGRVDCIRSGAELLFSPGEDALNSV